MIRPALPLAFFLAWLCACSTTRSTAPSRYCRPSDACWPKAEEWSQLASRLKGKLEKPAEPSTGVRNPFAFEDQSGATQSSGWLGAWTAAPSAYAVAAESAGDIAAAVDFAREHRLKLVIKATGHDYLGRSNAPDSLLIWTHPMREITLHDSFVPKGCAAGVGLPAVSLGAGTRWLEAYQKVTVEKHRYVQGGGCASVGAAGGFMQGGGFGSWSKEYGIAAASMLEAEVVTADGKILIADSCQNQELFWALRGGGGGTFGVVSRVTLETHPLPKRFGWVHGEIKAASDAAFKELLLEFLKFYHWHLSNAHWGESVTFTSHNTLEIGLAFEGMSAGEAGKLWQPFRAWVSKRQGRLKVKVAYHDLPGEKMWDYAFFHKLAPGAIKRDDRAGAAPGLFWWSDDDGQIGAYWYAYASRWIPEDKFEELSFADALFAASRLHGFSLHFNKGQAGASEKAVQNGRQTAMNPAVFNASALLIMGARAEGTPTPAEGQKKKAQIDAAMRLIRGATPAAGAYANEADYFEPDWRRSFWGENYARLLEIKQRVDPTGLFQCHHCVGSDEP